MPKKYRRLIFALLFAAVLAILYPFATKRIIGPEIFSNFAAKTAPPISIVSSAMEDAALSADCCRRIILVPLDSRPPCSSYVQSTARLFGTEIILPPKEFLDYYTKPSEKEKIATWLMETLKNPPRPIDAVILSVDQILSGGLIASREKIAEEKAAAQLKDFLKKLHAANPAVPLHAFSILPRLAPPPAIERYEERKAIMRYARLKDKIALGEASPAEKTEFAALSDTAAAKSEISPDHLTFYETIHPAHENIARLLAEQVADGTLAALYVGQDDGEKYGAGNSERRRLSAHFSSLAGQNPALAEKIHLVPGADELALTILARLTAQSETRPPKIAISYSQKQDAAAYFPYMAESLEKTAVAIIKLAGGEYIKYPQTADIIIHLHAGDSTFDALEKRAKAAREIKSHLEAGRAITLVDLSRHFTANETLLPLLIQNHAPINRLVSYAGWNTASNSIGTAVAESILQLAARQKGKKSSSDHGHYLSARSRAHLNARFLEDEFYLKDGIDRINGEYFRAGFKNTGDLDLDRDYRWLNALLNLSLSRRAKELSATAAWRSPFYTGPVRSPLFPVALSVSAYFPWPRTFEIQLETNLAFEKP